MAVLSHSPSVSYQNVRFTVLVTCSIYTLMKEKGKTGSFSFGPFTRTLACLLTRLLTCFLTHLLTHSLAHSLAHSFAHLASNVFLSGVGTESESQAPAAEHRLEMLQTGV